MYVVVTAVEMSAMLALLRSMALVTAGWKGEVMAETGWWSAVLAAPSHPA